VRIGGKLEALAKKMQRALAKNPGKRRVFLAGDRKNAGFGVL
jgi:hypothetical protein